MTPALNLETLVLRSGSHKSPEQGLCVMEAVSFVAGEPFSDHPECASKVIGAFLRAWNDSLNDTDRQLLKPYVLKLVGTKAGPDVELRRARLAQDWYLRAFTPAWLELAGLHEHAETLRTLRRIVDDDDLVAAQGRLVEADEAASAARNAAESAARSAARSAAWSAARNAAESAAWSAARSAAESAAEEALESTVKRLQLSAFQLLDAMIAEGAA